MLLNRKRFGGYLRSGSLSAAAKRCVRNALGEGDAQ